MDKELLFSVTRDDFVIETFRGSGPGGQNRNKRDTAVRIRHIESGAVAVCQAERTQLVNKKLAFKQVIETPIFKRWMQCKIKEAFDGKSLSQKVDEMTQDKFLKYETLDESGKWVCCDNDKEDI